LTEIQQCFLGTIGLLLLPERLQDKFDDLAHGSLPKELRLERKLTLLVPGLNKLWAFSSLRGENAGVSF
jgi:hypothetical protein